MTRWVVVAALVAFGCGEKCEDEWFYGECVAGIQSFGWVDSCTGEPIALIDQPCGMRDAGPDAGMGVGYWDDRTSDQVVASGRFAQMGVTADGENLWLADASRRVFARYDPATETNEEELDLEYEPLAFGVDATESRVALGFWDATVLQEISLVDGSVISELELTNVEGGSVHAVDVMAGPTYDGVERAGVWFVLTAVDRVEPSPRRGFLELVMVVDGEVAWRATAVELGYRGLHRLFLYEGSVHAVGSGMVSGISRLNPSSEGVDVSSIVSPDLRWGASVEAIVDARLIHDHGGIDQIIDGELRHDEGWACDVHMRRFAPAFASDGVAHFLISVQRSFEYERVLVSCDYNSYAPIDEAHVGPRDNVMHDLLPWSSNGWAMLDEFGRLETFRLD